MGEKEAASLYDHGYKFITVPKHPAHNTI